MYGEVSVLAAHLVQALLEQRKVFRLVLGDFEKVGYERPRELGALVAVPGTDSPRVESRDAVNREVARPLLDRRERVQQLDPALHAAPFPATDGLSRRNRLDDRVAVRRVRLRRVVRRVGEFRQLSRAEQVDDVPDQDDFCSRRRREEDHATPTDDRGRFRRRARRRAKRILERDRRQERREVDRGW